MQEILPKLVPMIIGLLISPIPVVALLIILMTPNTGLNAFTFIGGWLTGIVGVGLVIILFPILSQFESGNSTASNIIRLIIGLFFISWALWKSYKRYRNKESTPPKFFSRLDQFKPLNIFLIGLLVSAGNFKNLGFSAAAAIVLNQSLVDLNTKLGYLITYSTLGSLTLFIPMTLYLTLQQRADEILKEWKQWLIKYHDYLLSAVVSFIGVMIILG
ncbi:MAG: GAP family protein [Bacteroidota bacterium]